MSSIDERIVQMQFDNNQFESGVKTSLGTLDKLKSSLRFDNAGKGFDSISKAAKGVNLDPLVNSIETVGNRFNTLGIMGMAAINRLTNSAITAGSRLLKSFTIAPITAGYSKYEQKAQAMQTIMSATGKTIDEVTEKIDKLTWFTDETSYSLIDMTTNIGKFTSNGIELDKSVSAMMGIANAAALAGTDTQMASHAMEGFSKAMGSGAMKTQNWQWIKTARMDTKEFKDALIETAVSLGTLKKKGDEVVTTTKDIAVSYNNFEEGMKTGWITTEVMMETLDKYGKFANALHDAVESSNYVITQDWIDAVDAYKDGTLDMAAFAKKAHLPIEELSKHLETLSAKEMEVGERAFKAGSETKTLTEAINYVKDAVSSGWMTTFELIIGNYEEGKEKFSELVDVLYHAFVAAGETRNAVLSIWRDSEFGRDMFFGSLEQIFKSIIRLIQPVKDAFESIFPESEEGRIASMADALERFTDGFRRFAESIWLTDSAYGNLQKVFEAFFSIGKAVLGVIKTIWSFVKIFAGPLNALAGMILAIVGRIAQFITGVEQAAESSQTFMDLISKIREKVQYAADVLTILIKILTILILDFLDSIKASEIFQKAMSVVGKVLSTVVSIVKAAFDIFSAFLPIAIQTADFIGGKLVEGFSKLKAKILETFPSLGGIKDKLGELVDKIKGMKLGEKIFPKITSALTKLGAKATPIISKVTSALSKAFTTIKPIVAAKAPVVLSTIGQAFSKLGQLIIAGASKLGPAFETVKNIIYGLFNGILNFDFSGILGKITGVFSSVIEAVRTFIFGFDSTSRGMTKVATSIGKDTDDIKGKLQELAENKYLQQVSEKLSQFVKVVGEYISGLNPQKVLLFIFGAALVKTMLQIGDAASTTAKVIKDVGTSTVSVLDATKKFFGIPAALDNLSKSIDRLGRTTITQVATSIALLAGSLYLLSRLDWNELARGGGALLAIGVGLAVLSKVIGAIDATKFGKNSRSMITLAGTMVALSIALVILSKVDAEGIVPKALALGIAIAALAAVAVALNKFAPQLSINAAGIFGMALSMILLAKALQMIGDTIKNMENVDVVVQTMIEIMIGLGIMAGLAGKVGAFAGFAMIGLVGSLVLVDLVFKYLIKFGTSADEIKKNLGKIIPVFAAVASMMLAARLAGKHAIGAGIAAIAISYAVKMLIDVMKALDEISDTNAMNGLLLFMDVAFTLAIALRVIGDAGKYGIKAGIAALAITASVMLLTHTLKSMGDMLASIEGDTWKQKLLQFAALVGLLDTIIISIGFATNLSKEAKIGPLIAMIMGAGIVMAGIALLAGIGDNEALLAAAQTFAIGMLAFAGAMALASMAAENVKFFPLLAVATVAAAVAAGLYFLAKWPADSVIAAAGGLSITMLALATAARIANKGLKGAGVMLILAIDAVVASLALRQMEGIDWRSLLAGGASIGEMMILLGIAAHVAGKAIAGAGVMLVLAIDAVVASFALRQMQDIAWESLLAGGVAIGLMMNLLGIAAHIAGTAIAGAGVMLVLALDAVAAGFALSLLKDLDPEQIKMGAIAIAGALTVLSLAALVAQNGIAGAAAMIGFSVAMIAVAKAFQMMGTLNVDQMKQIGIAMSAVAGAFVLLSAIAMTPLAEGMIVAATTLVEFGAALDLIALAAVGFGFGVSLIVGAFERLGNMSTEQVDRATHAIEEFGTAIGTGLANIVISFGATIIEAIAKALSDAVSKIWEFVEPFITGARELIGGIIEGIKERAGEIKDNIGEAISNAAQKIEEFFKDFYDKGVEMVNKVVEGIKAVPSIIGDAFVGLINDAKGIISQHASDFTEAGKALIDGFVAGLRDNAAVSAVSSAANFIAGVAQNGIRLPLKINSPSKVMIPIGHSVGEGVAKGMKQSESLVYQQGRNLAKAQKAGYQDEIRVGGGVAGSNGRALLGGANLGKMGAKNRYQKKDATEAGKEFTQNLINGAKSKKKDFDKAVNTVTDVAQKGKTAWNEYKSSGQDALTYLGGKLEQYSSSSQNASQANGFFGSSLMDWITDPAGSAENAVSELTGATEESAAAAYSAGGAYKSAGKAAGGSAGGVGKATEAVKKQVDIMDVAKGAIEAYKEMYGDTMLVLSDTSPTDAAKRAIMGLAEATYYASLKSKDATEVAKEASDEAKSEIEKIADAYTKLRDKISGVIENQMDMFKKFEYDGEKITGTKILENMQSNADAAKRYEVDMKKMAEKGFAQPLMEKVAELGPKGIKTIEAFLKMSEEQVERANQLYGQLIELPYEATDKTFASWAYAGQMAMQGYTAGISSENEVASNKVFDVATQTLGTLETALEINSPSKKTFALGEFFSQGFIEGIASKADALLNAVSDLGKRALDNMGIFNDKSQAIKLGEDICLGLAEGIKSKTQDVIRAAKDMADAVLESTTDVLEINSPSKAFERIGMYSDEGLARGLINYSGRVGSAAEALGRGALDNVQSAIEFVKDMLNEGLDDGPTITPVLDLSNVASGAGAIDGLLNGTTLNAASAVQIQNDRNNLVDAMKDAFSSIMMSDTPNGDITINVYGAQGQDPRAIAEAVEERLLIKFNRLRAARA